MLQNDSKDTRAKKEKDGTPRQPDPETLGTSDPQEHMKGPVSSPTKNTGHAFETNETREEAEKVRDKNV